MLLFGLFSIFAYTYAKLPQTELGDLKSIVRDRNSCENVPIGQQCGENPNRKCVMMAFFARCKCVHGYVEDESDENKCLCPGPRMEKDGKCECPDGQVQIK